MGIRWRRLKGYRRAGKVENSIDMGGVNQVFSGLKGIAVSIILCRVALVNLFFLDVKTHIL